MEKKQKILNLCKYLLSADKETIRYIAKVIGNIVAFFPVVPFGKLFYRYLEREKTIALKKNQGNFDKLMSLSCSAQAELTWWTENMLYSVKRIEVPPVDLTVHTDASMLGWGVTDGTLSSGGLWDQSEADRHINYLELKAIEFGLRVFAKKGMHIRIMYAIAAIAYINDMGGIQSVDCNRLSYYQLTVLGSQEH